MSPNEDSPPQLPLPVLEGEGTVFRVSFWGFTFPFLVLMALILGMISAPTLLRLWADTEIPRNLRGILLILLFFLNVFGLIFLFWYCHFFYTIRVGRDGVRSHDFWGIVVSCRWRDMISAHFLRFFGFPYLRIVVRGRFLAIWMPLHLENKAGFLAEVDKSAPLDSPVRAPLQLPSDRNL